MKNYLKSILSILLLSSKLLTGQTATYTTEVVKDINSFGGSGIANVTFFNNKIIFSANDSVSGNEPWVSDGTAAGTFCLANIKPGAASSGPANFVVFNTKVLFTANNASGISLWETDGSAAGTALIKQFANASIISALTIHAGKFYFMADEGTTGEELWCTDGTAAGTYLVRDINPGIYSSNPQYMCSHTDGYLYFMAADTSYNYELWKTDGTNANTQQVVDMIPGVNGSYPTNLFSFNNKIYFACNDYVNQQQLWQSDGTAAGTGLFKIIKPAGNSFPTQFYKVNNVFVFQAENVNFNNELWVSDGTPAGTMMLKDINNSAGSSSNPTNFFLMGNKLYFSADNGVLGRELWETDGTTAGTVLKLDLNPGNGSSDPGSYYYNGTDFYLGANKGSGTKELLKFDLGTNTADLVCKINPTGSSDPAFIFELGTDLFAVANGPSGNELYKVTNGVGIQERKIKELLPVFPNPCQNEIHVPGDLAGKEYLIYNIYGAALSHGVLKGAITTADLPAGVYYLAIGGKTAKFIRE